MNDILRGKLKAVFTLEDLETIGKMMRDGNGKHIAAVVDIDSPAKEAALQELLDENKVPVNPEGSKVRAEMEKRMAAGEEIISSPEDEAEWQAKLDAEARGEKVDTEIKEKAMNKSEIAIELQKLGVEFDPAMKKSELKQLLEVATQ